MFSFAVEKLWNHVLYLKFQRTYTQTRTHSSVCSQHSLPSPPRAAWSRCDTQNAKPFCCNDFGSAGESHGRKAEGRSEQTRQVSQNLAESIRAGINCDRRKKEIWALTWISVRSSRLSLKRWFLWKERESFLSWWMALCFFVFWKRRRKRDHRCTQLEPFRQCRICSKASRRKFHSFQPPPARVGRCKTSRHAKPHIQCWCATGFPENKASAASMVCKGYFFLPSASMWEWILHWWHDEMGD